MPSPLTDKHPLNQCHTYTSYPVLRQVTALMWDVRAFVLWLTLHLPSPSTTALLNMLTYLMKDLTAIYCRTSEAVADIPGLTLATNH